jgi:hypothetical protein
VRAAIVIAGLAIAAGGGLLLYRTMRSAGAVAAGYGIRNGGAKVTGEEREAAIRRLEAITRPDAEDEDALTFLHYAAADAAARRHDAALWRRQLRATKKAARATLGLSPTRADAALALAEVEYLLGAPTDAVERPLLLSYLTAPRELWVIERRVGLGLKLAAVASPRLEAHIESDIRILGEPYRSTGNYRILARAAFDAGPAAIALVRDVLARGHPWPFHFFNEDLDRLRSRQRGGRH